MTRVPQTIQATKSRTVPRAAATITVLRPAVRRPAEAVTLRVVDRLLLVSQGDAVVVNALERRVVDLVAELLDPVAERVAAAVLSQNQVLPDESDIFGSHDLVGRARLQHAVLMNAGFVRERVLPDNRLVALHGHPGDL